MQMLETLVSIIPDEKGLSFLRGGLLFVFKAWGQRIKNQEQVLNMFAEILDVFTSVCENARLLQPDKTLQNSIVDLSNIIAGVLRELINILLREHTGNWFSKKLKSLPAVESDKIDKMVARLSAAERKIKDRIEYLKIQASTHQTRKLNSIQRDTQELRRKTSETFGVVRDEIRACKQEVTRAGANNVMSGMRMQEMNKQITCLISEISHLSVVQSALYQMIEDQALSQDLMGGVELRNHLARRRSHEGQRFYIEHESLLDMLDADPLTAIHETRDALRKSNTIKPQALERARSLLSEPNLRTWLTRTQPNALLVDGYCKADGAGRTSPLLILCASILSILAQNPSHIFISFFCSQHSDQDGITQNGPNAMLRSLIAQLTYYPHAEIRHIGPIEEDLVEALRNHDLGAFCCLFNVIVDRMDSSKTIYCLIDNISEFEIPWDDWDRQTLRVLQDLLGAAESRRYGARVKFLLTSSTHVNEIASLVDQDGDEYISMRAGKISSRPINDQAFQDDLELLTAPRRFTRQRQSY